MAANENKTNKVWECFVPGCYSSYRDFPQKFFFTIPSKPVARHQWIEAASRGKNKSPTGLYCCSDHFDLEEDMENYREWKFKIDQGMRTTTHMKPGVVPHIFPSQTNIVNQLLEKSKLQVSTKQETILESTPSTSTFLCPNSQLEKSCQMKILLDYRSEDAQDKPDISTLTCTNMAQCKTDDKNLVPVQYEQCDEQNNSLEIKQEYPLEIKQEELDISCECVGHGECICDGKQISWDDNDELYDENSQDYTVKNEYLKIFLKENSEEIIYEENTQDLKIKTEKKPLFKSNYRCIVPECPNTTKACPQKIFVAVPINKKKRKLWFKAMHRDLKHLAPKRAFVCEDHFDLSQDMENYLEFKMMGVRKRMKCDIVPHIFTCQLNRKRNIEQKEQKEAVESKFARVNVSTYSRQQKNHWNAAVLPTTMAVQNDRTVVERQGEVLPHQGTSSKVIYLLITSQQQRS